MKGSILRRAMAAILAAAIGLSGPGCVSLRAYEPGERACVRDGTGSVEVDLVGIRHRDRERPDGVEVRLRRLDPEDGPQDMFLLTDREGPTLLERLPAGRYEVRLRGSDRLGSPRDVRRTFVLAEGATMRVVLRDDWSAFKKEFATDLKDGLEATGEVLCEVGEVTLKVLIVAGVVVLYVGAAVLEASACCCR